MSIRKNRYLQLSHEEVRAYFDYIPESGELFFKTGFGKRCPVGARAGSVQAQGYRTVKFGGYTIVSTHLIWFWMTGKWPAEEIDHKNKQRGDDRWENLREATRSQNCMNRRRDNKLGFRGVSRSGIRNGTPRYMARIRYDGAEHFLGHYDSPEKAARAYDVAAAEHYGEFATLNFPAVKRDWMYVSSPNA